MNLELHEMPIHCYETRLNRRNFGDIRDCFPELFLEIDQHRLFFRI